MQYDEKLLKTTGDHCPSTKHDLAAMDIQDKPPQPLFLMISPLLLLKFLLSTIIWFVRKVHVKKQ